MPKGHQPKKMFTCRLPLEVYRLLDKIAKKMHWTRTGVAVDAIRSYATSQRCKKVKSLLAELENLKVK